MNNPEIQLVTVTDAPTLLFTGCGKVQIERVFPNNSQVAIGGPSVTYGSTAAQWRLLPNVEFNEEFRADAAIYGITSTGTTQVVRVTRWF